MPEPYQAEALDPSTLAELVRSRLLELIGEDVLGKAAAQKAADRAEIKRKLAW